jgi:TATA-box binding protein (TBP) (component of TFIID and TFIIIB)
MEKLLHNNEFINISTHTIDANLQSLVTLSSDILAVIFKDYLTTKTSKNLLKNKKNKSGEDEEFFNQISLAFPVSDFDNKDINLKYFNNGKIVMTGCRSMQDATQTLDRFLNDIKQNYETLKISKEIVDEVKITNVRISMINTDISINGLIQGKINKDINLKLLKKIKSDLIRPEYNNDDSYCQLNFIINSKKLNYIEKSEHHNYYIPIKIFEDNKIEIKVPKYRYIKLPKPNSKMKKKRSETIKLTINEDIKDIISKLIIFLKDNSKKLKIKNSDSIDVTDFYLPLIDYHYKKDEELRDLIINLYDMNEDLDNCTYEPCTYHGLNHRYIFMDGCTSEIHDHSFLKSTKNKKTKDCKCEKGTFLVFQSGHIIMIAKTYKKIQTLFEYMKEYLVENKHLVIF